MNVRQFRFGRFRLCGLSEAMIEGYSDQYGDEEELSEYIGAVHGMLLLPADSVASRRSSKR